MAALRRRAGHREGGILLRHRPAFLRYVDAHVGEPQLVGRCWQLLPLQRGHDGVDDRSREGRVVCAHVCRAADD